MTTPQKPADEDNPKTTELDPAELPSPSKKGTDEGTSPIHDELAAKTTSGSVTTDVLQSQPDAEEDSDDSAEDSEESEDVLEAPDTAKAYKVDVHRALERETDDGKGDEDPGPSDWNGYATEGVEEEEDV